MLFVAHRAAADSGQAFSISPPLIQLKADPGQTVNAIIKFTNISAGDLLIKTQFNDFGAKGEDGEPNIIFDDNENTPYSLRQWISGPQPFVLKSKQTQTVNFPITVPKNAEPGGHYAVIRFTGNAPEAENSSVSLSASIGSLVFLQVNGAVQQQAKLDDFYAAGSNLIKSGFFETGPITFVERIQNQGNIHLEPTGTLVLTNMFGKTVATMRVNGDPKDAANQPRNILPASIRRFTQSFGQTWLLGRYEAKLNLTYGSGEVIAASIVFWVIPYKLIALILIGGVALFFGLRWAIRRYNAYIIKQAAKRK
jgi:hypothetical protein